MVIFILMAVLAVHDKVYSFFLLTRILVDIRSFYRSVISGEVHLFEWKLVFLRAIAQFYLTCPV